MRDGRMISADFFELHQQAPMTVSSYFHKAVDEIDKEFGKGYAKNNPALVAAFISSCVNDGIASVAMKVFEDVLREGFSSISASIMENI